MDITQASFDGGLDLLNSEAKIAENCYRWVINGRNRLSNVEPIKKSLELEKPDGKLQGGISVGNVLIIFVAGKAYYFIEDSGMTDFAQIPAFQMSETAVRLYAQAVPESTSNFLRKLDPDSQRQNGILMQADFKVSGTKSCVVVQDGINQPWLIFYQPSKDGVPAQFSSRVSKNYSQWTNTSIATDDREYIPIGKQMMFLDQILFVVAADGKSVYRSITGRPLDFMINVDTNGNKMASELYGGAKSMSFAFDYDEITCIRPTNLTSSFILATKRNVRIIQFDFSQTVFDEPRFREATKIEAGIINQESVVELRGDYAFLDTENVKSFNAVMQLKNEGRNSIFSKNLAAILKKRKQLIGAAVMYDNYALFSLHTTFGYVICVYDTITQSWSSLDITSVSHVFQFLTTDTTSETRLYALTTNNEVFRMYVGPECETTQLRIRALEPAKGKKEHKGRYVNLTFSGALQDGRVTLIELVDEKESNDVREWKPLPKAKSGVPFPVRPPVGPSSLQRLNNITFATINGGIGKRIAYVLMWTGDSMLENLQVVTTEFDDSTAQKQKQSVYNNSYGSTTS